MEHDHSFETDSMRTSESISMDNEFMGSKDFANSEEEFEGTNLTPDQNSSDSNMKDQEEDDKWSLPSSSLLPSSSEILQRRGRTHDRAAVNKKKAERT